MKYIAYHRTSTLEQRLERGIAEITQFCSDNAYSSIQRQSLLRPANR